MGQFPDPLISMLPRLRNGFKGYYDLYPCSSLAAWWRFQLYGCAPWKSRDIQSSSRGVGRKLQVVGLWQGNMHMC